MNIPAFQNDFPYFTTAEAASFKNITRLTALNARNALSVTFILLDMLRKTSGNFSCPKAMRHIESVRRSATLLGHYVELLLEDRQATNCNRYAHEVFEEIRELAGEDCIDLVADSLPLIRSSPAAVILLFRNLMLNLVQLSKDKCAISVKIGAVPSAAGWEFSVSGRGSFAPERQWQSAFGSGPRTQLAKLQDEGLELALCRHIVEMQGGKIWVSTMTPEEIIFKFTLPE